MTNIAINERSVGHYAVTSEQRCVEIVAIIIGEVKKVIPVFNPTESQITVWENQAIQIAISAGSGQFASETDVWDGLLYPIAGEASRRLPTSHSLRISAEQISGGKKYRLVIVDEPLPPPEDIPDFPPLPEPPPPLTRPSPTPRQPSPEVPTRRDPTPRQPGGNSEPRFVSPPPPPEPILSPRRRDPEPRADLHELGERIEGLGDFLDDEIDRQTEQLERFIADWNRELANLEIESTNEILGAIDSLAVLFDAYVEYIVDNNNRQLDNLTDEIATLVDNGVGNLDAIEEVIKEEIADIERGIESDIDSVIDVLDFNREEIEDEIDRAIGSQNEFLQDLIEAIGDFGQVDLTPIVEAIGTLLNPLQTIPEKISTIADNLVEGFFERFNAETTPEKLKSSEVDVDFCQLFNAYLESITTCKIGEK